MPIMSINAVGDSSRQCAMLHNFIKLKGKKKNMFHHNIKERYEKTKTSKCNVLLALKGSMLKLLKYVKNVMKGKEKLNCLKKDKDTEEKVFNRP